MKIARSDLDEIWDILKQGLDTIRQKVQPSEFADFKGCYVSIMDTVSGAILAHLLVDIAQHAPDVQEHSQGAQDTAKILRRHSGYKATWFITPQPEYRGEAVHIFIEHMIVSVAGIPKSLAQVFCLYVVCWLRWMKYKVALDLLRDDNTRKLFRSIMEGGLQEC